MSPPVGFTCAALGLAFCVAQSSRVIPDHPLTWAQALMFLLGSLCLAGGLLSAVGPPEVIYVPRASKAAEWSTRFSRPGYEPLTSRYEDLNKS